VLAFAGQKRHRRAGTLGKLGALARLELDGVDGGADRDVAQLEGIARLNFSRLAAHDLVPDLQTDRREAVALLAVDILQQRDARRAVRVVLDGDAPGRNPVLVALEVDDPVTALVAAADPAACDAAQIVAAAG